MNYIYFSITELWINMEYSVHIHIACIEMYSSNLDVFNHKN